MINITDIFVNKNIMMIKSAMSGTNAALLALTFVERLDFGARGRPAPSKKLNMIF